jgi:hypothetical protein
MKIKTNAFTFFIARNISMDEKNPMEETWSL